METIAVIFGGQSAEHDVSIITAVSSVIKPLELTKRYRVEAIYIAKDGSWHWSDKLKNISFFTSGDIDTFLMKDTPASVKFDGGFTITKPLLGGRQKAAKIDLVFPAMHGTNGEDGALMGLLTMAGVPYVGCDPVASGLAMDKVLAKLMAEAHGIPIARFKSFPKHVVSNDIEFVVQKCKDLSFPLFVKPAHLGSSIGISRAGNQDELRNALEVAAHYDDKVLVEEAISNLIEVTLPIMGNDEPMPAMLEKPLTTADDFFDFETKYMQGGKKGKGKGGGKQGASQGYSQIPAELPKELYEKAIDIGCRVYLALGCTGIARVDMLIDSKTKEVYFNEANPLPGGLYAHNWRAAGVSGMQLVEKLIGLAKERHQAKTQLATTFETSYLKQF